MQQPAKHDRVKYGPAHPDSDREAPNDDEGIPANPVPRLLAPMKHQGEVAQRHRQIKPALNHLNEISLTDFETCGPLR